MYESPDPRPALGRRVALVAGMVLATLVLLGATGVVLFGGTSGSAVKSAPQVSRPTVVTPSLERPTPPSVYPTQGMYVPPVPTVAPTIRKPSLKPTKPTAQIPQTTRTPRTTPQRPTCPLQWAYFHDWCVQHGYQPPEG